MTIYRYTLISLFVLLVGTTAWTSFTYYQPPLLKIAAQVTVPDAIMEGVNALIMDQYGKPTMKILTPKLLYYKAADATHFISPALTLYRKSSQPWQVSANVADATSGMDHIDFRENVAIHHAADESHPATFIKTEHLRVHTITQTAETDDLITLTQPNILMNAIGMRADMTTGHIQLLSQARGEYFPDA